MEEPIEFSDRIVKIFKIFAIHMVGSFRDLAPIKGKELLKLLGMPFRN